MTASNGAVEITLNVSYELPKEDWASIARVYERMPGWRGYHDGCPAWFGYEGDPKYIWASVEPGGLQIVGEMPINEWEPWIAELCVQLSKVLRYEIRDAEA